MNKFSEIARDRLNIKHSENPEVGDFWHEIFSPIARVLQVEEKWIVIQKLSGQGGEMTNKNDPMPIIMSRRDFKKWIRYESIPDKTWADVIPRHLADAE